MGRRQGQSPKAHVINEQMLARANELEMIKSRASFKQGILETEKQQRTLAESLSHPKREPQSRRAGLKLGQAFGEEQGQREHNKWWHTCFRRIYSSPTVFILLKQVLSSKQCFHLN